MPRNVDGEFEVLLGNRQLLSVFFIVIILLAVFFTMGYVLGRSSGAITVAARAPVSSPAPSAPTPAMGLAEPSPAPAAPPAVVETPAKPEPKPVAVKSATPPAPAPGQVYLQVAAAKRPDAELVGAVLKKKGFATLIAPGPTETVFRVLVGPLVGAGEIGKARTDLEKAGFKPMLRKY